MLTHHAAAAAGDGGRHHLPFRHRRDPGGPGPGDGGGRGKDVRLGGGVATIRQYLQAGLIDEMHLALAPVLLGAGRTCGQG